MDHLVLEVGLAIALIAIAGLLSAKLRFSVVPFYILVGMAEPAFIKRNHQQVRLPLTVREIHGPNQRDTIHIRHLAKGNAFCYRGVGHDVGDPCSILPGSLEP